MRISTKIIFLLSVFFGICSIITAASCQEFYDQCTTDYCIFTPTPCDLGGGKLLDQNYVMLAPVSLNIGDPGEVRFYYKNKYVELIYHRQENGNYIWGISTEWAYIPAHWDWKDKSNWRMYFK